MTVSMTSEALRLQDQYTLDFACLMEKEYENICIERNTQTVTPSMVREAWQRLMLDSREKPCDSNTPRLES